MFYVFYDEFGNTDSENFEKKDDISAFFQKIISEEGKYPLGYVNSKDDNIIVDETYLKPRSGLSKEQMYLSVYEQIENAYLSHDDILKRSQTKTSEDNS